MTDTLNTTQTDETTLESWDVFVERQTVAQAAGDVPPALAIAARDLMKLAVGDSKVAPVCDYDTPADYRAAEAAIALCRAALDEIAIAYDESLARDIAYHRAALASIEAAGLLEVE
jgi:hypothetical protein